MPCNGSKMRLHGSTRLLDRSRSSRLLEPSHWIDTHTENGRQGHAASQGLTAVSVHFLRCRQRKRGSTIAVLASDSRIRVVCVCKQCHHHRERSFLEAAKKGKNIPTSPSRPFSLLAHAQPTSSRTEVSSTSSHGQQPSN